MKSRFFCIAVEGATTDARVIEASWINEMAANYNPATYAARVNMEHVRGYTPDPPFNAYGDVLALEARDIELTLNGQTEKKRALFAQIEANDQLLAINKKGQKLYSSIEVNPNFAGKGQAYLMGLAVTDSPASLGTEMLQFAAKATVNPLATRKQQPGNLFTATGDPIDLQFDDAVASDPAGTGFNVKDLVASIAQAFTGAPAAAAATTPTAAPPQPAPADTDKLTAAFTSAVEQLGKAIADQGDRFAKAQQASEQNIAQLMSEVSALQTRLTTSPSGQHAARPLATGGAGDFATDC